MKIRTLKHSALISAILIFLPQTVMAYVGPGAGLSAIGAFFALVFCVIVAVFGLIWYPLKKLFRKPKQKSNPVSPENAE